MLHFLGIGAILFGVSSLRSSREREIVVTPALREELRRALTDAGRRAPTNAELERALRNWKRDEALYREGITRGLDRNDAEVRARVIAKLLAVQRGLFIPPEPRPEELDVWLEQNRARYELPVRYDFEHVFAAKDRPDARKRALAFVKDLESNQPETAGDHFADGSVFLAQSPQRIQRVFGAKFAEAIPALVPGRWTAVESDHGWHAVRLRLAEGGLPARELLGERLVEDFQAAALQAAIERYAASIETKYQFREEP
jgi:hypothetical protein